MSDDLKFALTLDTGKYVGGATAAALATAKLVDGMGKLEKASRNPISKTPGISVAPIKSIGGPSAEALKAQEKEQKATAKAAAQAEKLAAKEALAVTKAADKAKVAEAKATAKALEAEAKSEAAFQKAVTLNKAKADKQQFKEAEKAAKAHAKAMKKAEEESSSGAFKKAFGEANDAASGFESLGSALGAALNPTTILAAAVLGLGAALATAVIGGASLSIQASELKAVTVDALEAFLGSQAAANDVYDRIGDITETVAISQERATGLARELSAAGITSASALTDAITSIRQVESVLGAEAGGKIQSVLEKAAQSGKFTLNAKQLAGTGVQIQSLYSEIGKRLGIGNKEVEKQLAAGKISAEVGIASLTKVLDTKFGGVAAKQVLDLGSQLQHFRDNFSKLFEDVDTGPFLDGLHSVLNLFDQSTTSGQALKAVLTSTFNGLFRVVGAVAPYVENFFKGLFLIVLRVAIAFKPLLKQLGALGESKDGAQGLASAMIVVANAIGVVAGWFVKLVTFKPYLYTLGVTFGLIAAAVGVLALGAALLAAPFIIAGAAIAAFIGYGIQLVTWLGTLAPAAVKAGGQLIDGLILGLSQGAARLTKAVTGMAQGAVDSFKATFGIHSPSKVMASMGNNLTLGLAQGINLGAPAANDALSGAVQPARALAPAQATASKQGAQTSTGSGSLTIEKGAIQITITGVPGADGMGEQIGEVLISYIERYNQSRGVGTKAA